MAITKKLLVIAALVFFVSPVSAHVLEVDGDIGAVLHVNPNDDPVAGEPATFYLDIVDKSGRFSEEDCDCIISITENGKSLLNSSFIPTKGKQYIFTKRGIYNIAFTGAPKTSGSFQSFQLKYVLRVDKITKEPSKISEFFKENTHYVIFGAPFVIIYLKFAFDKLRKKT